jgi:hypothetical protein
VETETLSHTGNSRSGEPESIDAAFTPEVIDQLFLEDLLAIRESVKNKNRSLPLS